MFACKICREKDARILDLKDEIKSLRSAVMPMPHFTLQAHEADNLLSGTQDVMHLTEKDISRAELEVAERDSLLSGTYAD